MTFAAHFLAAAGRGGVAGTLLRGHDSTAGTTGLWCPLGADGLGLARTSAAAASSPALGMVLDRQNTAAQRMVGIVSPFH